MPERKDSIENTSRFGSFLSAAIAVGLMIAIAFTALAHGAVEPWSVMTFGVIVIVLLALWILKAIVDRKLTIAMPSAAVPLMALLVLGVLQSIAMFGESGKRIAISLDPEATRLVVEVIGYLLIALLLAANVLVRSGKMAWFRNFIVVFGLAMAVFGLVQHFTWNGKYFWVVAPSTKPSSPFGPFVNHNHFAGFLEMIAPIPLALVLVRAVRGELALFYGFATVMMAIATVVSLSRGGMVSLVAGLMFVVSLGLKPESGKHRMKGRASVDIGPFKIPAALSRYGAIAIIVLTIGAGVLWMGADPVIRRVERTELSLDGASKEPGKETFFQSRGWIWRDTLALIRANWVTGIGLGAYQTVFPIYSKRDGAILVSQAHNDYLQVLADGGIVAALLTVWFLFLSFRDIARAARHRDPMIAGLALGCGGGLFALMVHSLFDFNLQLPSNALLFLVLSAVVSRAAAKAVEGKVNQPFFERATRLKVAA